MMSAKKAPLLCKLFDQLRQEVGQATNGHSGCRRHQHRGQGREALLQVVGQSLRAVPAPAVHEVRQRHVSSCKDVKGPSWSGEYAM